MSQKKCSLRKKVSKVIGCDYLVHLPEGYAKSKKAWPLILFLHGSGERGKDLEMVKVHGVAKIVESDPKFPFIAVSPQCPADEWWATDVLTGLLDTIEKKYRVDKSRIYLTGLSMGGYGTWELAFAQPKRFAAIAPVCGGGNPHLTWWLKDIPTWVFHGAKDTAVPLEESERMVKALKHHKADVKLTVYPEAGHDSWTETYANPKLYEWFLLHRLKKKTGRK
jgi:predicted peptidase